MKKFTSLLLTFTLLLFCSFADAYGAKPEKPASKNAVLALIAKNRTSKTNSPSSHSKKETQKKLATYTYIDVDETTGTATDTSEHYVVTWADNGLPSKVTVTGYSDDFVEDKRVPYRVTYSNFVRVNANSESEFSWLYDGADFDAITGILEVYNNNTWQNFAKLEKTVSPQGYVQQVVVSNWLLGVWVNESKETYTYDAKGNRTESVEQSWNINQWVNDSRWMEFYDTDGRSTGYQQDIWENNSWVSEYGTKLTYTKNAGNQIVSAIMEEIAEDGTWIMMTRQTYEWTSNEISKVTEEKYDNGTWNNSTQYRDITWKAFDASYPYWSYPVYIGGTQYISYDSYTYDNFSGDWTMSSRQKNVYTGDNMTESVYLYYNGTDWDTANRSTYVYYPNGDLKEYKSWAKQNDEWIIQYGYGNTNTYDADGDITRSEGFQWDAQKNAFVDSYTELYTYINVTVGIAKNGAKTATINVYPNPATSGNITIAKGNNSSKALISVYDNTGKLVMQRADNAGNITMDVSALPKGLYIINVNQSGSISKAQFIIQ